MSIGVVIGTFGDEEKWGSLVENRSRPSVVGQTLPPDEFIWCHDYTLAEARNRGAMMCATDVIIFLDADDELDQYYIQAMRAANGRGEIKKPSTLGVYSDGSEDDHPVMIKAKRTLQFANHIVIGAGCDFRMFRDVGGFRDLPILEDWDLWRRMWYRGAKVVEVPNAIYRVHISEGSRNTNQALHNDIYEKILSGD